VTLMIEHGWTWTDLAPMTVDQFMVHFEDLEALNKERDRARSKASNKR